MRLRILVVDDEPSIRLTLRLALERGEGNEIVAVGSAAEASAEAGRRSFDLAFVDLRLGTSSGLDLIPQLLALSPRVRIVVITAFVGIDTAVEAIKRGAFDYLPKPFTPAQIDAVVTRVAEVRRLEQAVTGLQDAVGREPVELESHNPAMRRAIDLARQVAPSEATVLLQGESGTGKGVLARAIHQWSPRRGRPMATVSCPSLSAELLESELFGHIRGAFTGALRDHPGRIEVSDGGTLFLDEIGDLPLNLQPKLLRFLQEREYERVGDTRTRQADVRVIAATNVDLAAAVRSGTFREDLFYRLNVIQIDIPPLRSRPEDIAPLAEYLLASLRGSTRGRSGPLSFTPEAIAALRAYHWPGNVRELKNLVERCAILSRGERIGVENMPLHFAGSTVQASVELGDPVPFEKIEQEHIRKVISRAGSLEDAARILDIDAATLWRKRRKYGI